MKNRFQDLTSIDFYQNRKQVKWLLVVVSLLIGAGSIWYTNSLVEELRERERRQIELLSSALEYAASTAENLTFINQEIIQQNYSIPIIMVDPNGNPFEYRNITFKKNATAQDSAKTLEVELIEMKEEYEPILLEEADIHVYYRNSELLLNLKYYPYIQLAVILIFGALAYALFNQSKIAEQNRVWAGLTKETAHQLGTPIASLMAWIDYLRNSPVWEENKEIITEMDKDVVKLRMVTERFSSIGSKPVIQAENLYQVIEETISYLRPRISTKVELNIKADSQDLDAMMNKPLFEWVVENICKNAVDAMKGKGKITLELLQDSDKFVIVDITDTGKGMEKKMYRRVFNPGFSTKQRGWGLGLTLAKRIIESYHGGKIFVKSSEVGVGTTFRIILHSTREGAEQFVTEGILEYK
ncbi:sensor histidine kinase [Algoriphagus zhangzhouensis]|uniref:histidine kinase n=1 Tax=Algoriphagus zhangzhouensis TaxID=1073327 RepID=A0A1M7ZID5_9BACT|nr:ATP-binding protein [Algoriphagus zhangzhouensis]TDY43780.1 histidine kinase/DNA gyrase B/HSP90-like ATPase [Algoriphagus zhangzhouensis]SHO64680.1 Histidine kinase-, DNA gyrase B-, and HSP90-like ATPase [Algoriphagus zhangzhouensis]